MSEYQYYEFLAVDRPLTSAQMSELRSVSSRAEITPRSFTNEYHYGDLRGDARELLWSYFDVLVYVANWGTHRVAFRVPRACVDPVEAEQYCCTIMSAMLEDGEYVVFDLTSEDEEYGGWENGSGWMGALAGVRTLLMQGDLRPLYLIWLHAAWSGDIGDDEVEPPVPAGLGDLPPGLVALTEFLRIDTALLDAAAEGSDTGEQSWGGLARWVSELRPAEKDALLVQVAMGDHAVVSALLARNFRASTRSASVAPRRTFGDLLARAEVLRARAMREQQQAEERARREKAALDALAKERRLDRLATRVAEAWVEVQQHVSTKKPREYDLAVRLLRDLRDLAERDGEPGLFASRVEALRAMHSRKGTFIRRLDEAGLG